MKYVYFGLKKSIMNNLVNGNVKTNVISLSINIDGLPLFKSSRMQFWPILGIFHEVKMKWPFLIEIFCGNSKGKPLTEYLEKNIERIAFT